jgi:hypothetical protein
VSLCPSSQPPSMKGAYAGSEIIQGFHYVPFRGPVRMKKPEVTYYVYEDCKSSTSHYLRDPSSVAPS